MVRMLITCSGVRTVRNIRNCEKYQSVHVLGKQSSSYKSRK